MFAFQFRFRNPLPHVLGHKDYRLKAQLYESIDDILNRSKLDEIFIEHALKHRDRLRKEILAHKLKCDPKELDGFDLSADDFARPRFIEHCLVAFRSNITSSASSRGIAALAASATNWPKATLFSGFAMSKTSGWSTRPRKAPWTDTSAGFPAKISIN